MAILDIRQRTGYLFLALLLGHVVLISSQVNTRRGVPLLEAAVFGAFAEVQRAASGVLTGATTAWDGYIALRGVRSENAGLRRELDQLRIRLQQEQATAAEARTLQQLLGMKQATPLPTEAAAVIAGGASPDFRTITIDKGTFSGLKTDMAVVAPAGVVGRVIMAGGLASKVQLLIDRNAAAGVVVERSRAQGVVVGLGTGRLRMDYVPGSADVQPGDMVVTSGIDGIYPKGFVVGQIESVKRGAGEYSGVIVRPAVDFQGLESVLVVTAPPSPAEVEAPAVQPAAPAAAKPATPVPVAPGTQAPAQGRDD